MILLQSMSMSLHSLEYECWTVVLVLLVSWLLLGGHRTIYLLYHTLPRDLVIIKRLACVLVQTLGCKVQDKTIIDLLVRTASSVPDKAMVIFCDEAGDSIITFRQCLRKSLRIAHYFRDQGFKKGDVVAVMLENRVDYCCYWLGLAVLGAVPALINTNLRHQALAHTLTVVTSKAVIFSADTEKAISEIRPDLTSLEPQLYCADTTDMAGAVSLAEVLPAQSEEEDILAERRAGYQDTLLYIYTSGTTGMPKAATVRHSRFLMLVHGMKELLGLGPRDVLYSALPMYHAAAGVIVLGAAMSQGLTMVSRRKFSATRFWQDCRQHGVTAAQYIGEICRYLLATPESARERRHGLRMVFGNGMRRQVWPRFQARFGVPRVCEYYGATEGNCSVANVTAENRVGAVGFVSVLFPFLLPLYVVKVDENTGEPLRAADGRAIECAPGEAGELIGRIQRGHPVRDFHGYSDNSSTDKKIIRDVFRSGDTFFRSGDILIKDELGWLYFKDRAGDTFRWKGENVSTMEVEAIVSQVVGLRDCVVFGVQVPGTEGRAGMAVIPDPDLQLDLASLYSGLCDKLPSYARPVFVRFVKELSATGTHKLKKTELQKEAYNIENITDDVYIINSKMKTYSKVDVEMYHNILNGNMRF